MAKYYCSICKLFDDERCTSTVVFSLPCFSLSEDNNHSCALWSLKGKLNRNSIDNYNTTVILNYGF